MKSRKIIFFVFCMIFIAGTAGAQEAEKEKDWSLKLEFPLYSKYMWRGITLVDNWVFQPSLEGNYKWLTAAVWSNMDLTNENEYPGNDDPAGDINEIDYTIDLSENFGKVGVSVGAVFYTYPNTEFDWSGEVYAGISADVILQPAVTAYYDVQLVHGIYVNFEIGHSFEEIWKPSEKLALSLDLGAGLGIADERHNVYYYGSEEDGWAFTDALFQVGLPVAVGDYVTIKPTASYSLLIDNEIRELVEEPDNFWYGVAFSVSL